MSFQIEGGNPNMDYAEHMKTYKLFIRLSIWTTALVVALLIGMKIFLV